MKNYNIIKKIFIVLFLSFIAFGVYKFIQIQEQKKVETQKEIEKFSNIESEIFNLTEEENALNSADQEFAQINDSQLSELTVEQLKGSGAEFVYQLLVKNQLQIAALKEDIKVLRLKVAQQNSKEKISKLVFSYIDLRQKIFEKRNSSQEFEVFNLLAANNKFLKEESEKLKINVKNFESNAALRLYFRSLIPDLIATKNHDKDAGFFEKIRHSLAKIIVIRKNDITAQDLDGIILRVQKHLENNDYEGVILELKNLDEKYVKILADFIKKLNSTNEIYKTDQEIIAYLRQLA